MAELSVAATYPKEQGWHVPRTWLLKKGLQPENRVGMTLMAHVQGGKVSMKLRQAES